MPLSPGMLNKMDLVADSLLFLSGLLLLIDIAPRDLLPRAVRQKKAVAKLRECHNLLFPPPPNTTIRPETQGLQQTVDAASAQTIVDLIRERSPLAHTVPWDRIIGVGYSTLSLPIGQLKLEAFHPLYVAIMPPLEGNTLELIPVGQLEDLDQWLKSWRQTSLTLFAAGLLTLGFLMQLIIRLLTP